MRAIRGAAAGAVALLLVSCAGPGGPQLGPRLAATGVPSSAGIAGVPFFPQTEHHCGPAALATLLVFDGVDTDPGRLAPMIYLPGRRGTLAAEMTAAVRRLGRMPHLLEGGMEDLVAEVAGGRPVAVLLNLGARSLPRWHYAVVIGYDGSREELLLRSGRTREKVMTAGRFARAWEGSRSWGLIVTAPGEVPATAREVPYFRQAAAFESAGMAEAAEAAWRGAARRWPESPLPRLGLGNALAAQGRLAEAEAAFRRLLTLAPQSVEGRNNLAHVLSLRGCHEEALRQIDRAAASAAGTDHAGTVAGTRREILERRAAGGGAGDCAP